MIWFYFVVVVYAAESGISTQDLKDKTMDKPDLNKFLVPPENAYMDWWKITEENIKQRVTESIDPWIISIHPKNQNPSVWKNEAPKYRSVIFFGKLLDEDLNDKMTEKFKYIGKPKVM